MTPERTELLKQLKRANKLWRAFFFVCFGGCAISSYQGSSGYAIMFMVLACVYFGLIRLNEWYVGKIEKLDKKV